MYYSFLRPKLFIIGGISSIRPLIPCITLYSAFPTTLKLTPSLAETTSCGGGGLVCVAFNSLFKEFITCAKFAI